MLHVLQLSRRRERIHSEDENKALVVLHFPNTHSCTTSGISPDCSPALEKNLILSDIFPLSTAAASGSSAAVVVSAPAVVDLSAVAVVISSVVVVVFERSKAADSSLSGSSLPFFGAANDGITDGIIGGILDSQKAGRAGGATPESEPNDTKRWR